MENFIPIITSRIKANKTVFILGFIAVLSTSNNCLAESKYRYGIGLNNGTFSVDDPSGPTNDENTSFLSAVMALPMSKNTKQTRWWLEGYYRSFSLNSDATNIGQDVTSIGFSGIAQYSFSVSSVFRPWLGVGAGINFSEYTSRENTDSDGFKIGFDYADRNETNLDALINAGISLRKTDAGIYFGLNLVHHIALDNGVGGTRITLFALF